MTNDGMSDQDLIARAESLSRQFIENYYRHDVDACRAVCTDDLLYIATTEGSAGEGIDLFTSLMTTTSAMFYPSQAVGITLQTRVRSSGQHVLVVAQFRVVHGPLSSYMNVSQKRATLLWRVSDDGMRLCHLHLSTPYHIVSAEEQHDGQQPNADTYHYVKALLDQVIRHDAVELRAVDGTLHYLASAEVRYVEAQRQTSVIHGIDRSIAVRRGFNELVTRFGNDLTVVHRSYAVNPLYVHSISTRTVTLDDGTAIPLPQRRATEVRHQLQAAVERMHNSMGRFRIVAPQPRSAEAQGLPAEAEAEAEPAPATPPDPAL